MSIFVLRGNQQQNALVESALAKCDFPWSRMLPSLRREGKTTINVDWQDLTRFGASQSDGHNHIHDDHGAVAHPIQRVVEGRSRVLGLFYLPPHTRIVMDLGLVERSVLGEEVLLDEAGHAVDYHYMTNAHRLSFINSLHRDQLPDDYVVRDGVALGLDGHVCSWFDVGPYAAWVGETVMEGFVRAFAPRVPVSMTLNHPVKHLSATRFRWSLLGVNLFGTKRGRAFHLDSCPFIRASWRLHKTTWVTPEDAVKTGRKPCRVCDPPTHSWA